ncbi:hypothetical protein [Cryptosporangium arvum]|uniref:Uncharacterized protein n=1 Tax=Cryptosporangium arvum DSM 44712 TaxID=927661 RepID=A0A011AD97_9ACTN|nr:hypothetical protein [Cryptosporangium arvum]EXG80031.1 hypothetical protein CryarDRAFT_1090 [Cryptosporangium arvum DSM 44712]
MKYIDEAGREFFVNILGQLVPANRPLDPPDHWPEARKAGWRVGAAAAHEANLAGRRMSSAQVRRLRLLLGLVDDHRSEGKPVRRTA